MRDKKEHIKNSEKRFESDLIQSLKYYGNLFPDSIADVERFQSLYGDTEIDIPEHLNSLEKIQAKSSDEIDFDLTYNIAAFSSTDNSDISFLDNLDLDEEENDEKE